MSRVLVKQLLTSSNYWTLNKTVVRIFGIETAFLLTNLAEAESMMSDDNGWFFQTTEKLEEVSTLSRYKQDKSIDELINEGILEKDVRGIPAKRYFKLNYEALTNKIVNNSQNRVRETDKLDSEKPTTNKELIYKELKDKSSSSEPPKFREISKFYQQNFGVLSPYTAENMNHWVKDIGGELVLEALKRSLKQGKQYSYAEGIMKNWANNNIKTLEDVEAEEVAFKNRKKKSDDVIDDLWEV